LVDERSLISVTIDVLVVGNSLVMRCFVMSGDSFVMDWSSMGSLMVDRGDLMKSLRMDWSSFVWGLLVDNLSVVVDSLGIMVGSLGLVVCGDVMGILMDGFLVVDDLVVSREITSVAIVVVHFEDKVAVFDVDLAAHEKRRVVLKAPVITGVPLLGVKCVEIVSPAEFEVLAGCVVVIDLNEIVLSIPRHLSVIEIVVPW